MMEKKDEYNTVKIWIRKTCGTEISKKGYVNRLQRFLEYCNVNPDNIIQRWREVRYDWTERQKFIDEWSEKIEEYYALLDLAPLSARARAWKFFRNNMRVPDTNFREFWMCHSIGVDDSYISKGVSRHREEYKKGYSSLRVCEASTTEHSKLIEENRQLRELVAKLSMQVQGIHFVLKEQLGVPEETINEGTDRYKVASKILDEPNPIEKPSIRED